MSKSLVDALNNGPWSVSAVVFDLNDMLDDENRPVSERRADAAVRANVEMDMRLCPYAGPRNRKWMNYSALVQISSHFNAVLAEMAAFRRQRNSANPTWDDIHAGVIDLLARPAIYLLQQHSEKGPVPAQHAVSHKLAAGFFGVLRNLHERHALGFELPVSVDSFMNLVEETNALVGSTEVCSGSPLMIRKACVALIDGTSETRAELDQLRLDLARSLALQVQLGIFWDLYDRVHQWSLLRGTQRPHLKPYNQFLTKKLEESSHSLHGDEPTRPRTEVLPNALDATVRSAFTAALNDSASDAELAGFMKEVLELLNEPGSVVQYQGNIDTFAHQAASYLHTMQLFKTELSRQELELRKLLGYAADTPIKLGTAAFPPPQAQHWYELILGKRLGEDGHLSGSSTGIRVASK